MADPLDEPALVAFDFDGTPTVEDSFTAFLKWHAGPCAGPGVAFG